MGFSLIYIIKNKISEKFTLFGAFFGLLNCVVWLCWSSYNVSVNGEPLEYSIVANCLGICLVICQFVFIFIFRKKDNDEDDVTIDEKTKDLNPAGIAINNSENEIKDNDPDYMKDYI